MSPQGVTLKISLWLRPLLLRNSHDFRTPQDRTKVAIGTTHDDRTISLLTMLDRPVNYQLMPCNSSTIFVHLSKLC